MRTASYYKDIKGQKFGRLTAIRYAGMYDRDHSQWEWECECGVRKVIITTCVKTGMTRSCGCFSREVHSQPRPYARTHGKSHTPIWTRHQQMMRRCYNQSDPNFFRYGGRGIYVSQDWHRFENFYRDMGDPPTPKHSIDRVNNDGPYAKENCRWATMKEQCNNRRSNRIIEFRGKKLNIAQWASTLGMNHKAMHLRISKGWTIERALTQPYRFAAQAEIRRKWSL